ncbi:unnamed protein product, partial [Phaeothamnion confervicola]
MASGKEFVVNVPTMGDSITEGTVVQWLKATGDAVAQDEVVVVLETDKVSIDVRAPEAGKILECLAGEGDTVAVGAPLIKLDTSAAPGGGAAPAAAAPAPARTAPQASTPAPAAAPASTPMAAPAPAPAKAPTPAKA